MYVSSDASGEFKRLAYMEHRDMTWRWHPKLAWDVVDIAVHGDRLVFLTNEDGSSRLSVMEKGVVFQPDLPMGIISNMKFSPGGNHLGFTLSRPDTPADAYSYDLEREGIAQVPLL